MWTEHHWSIEQKSSLFVGNRKPLQAALGKFTLFAQDALVQSCAQCTCSSETAPHLSPSRSTMNEDSGTGKAHEEAAAAAAPAHTHEPRESLSRSTSAASSSSASSGAGRDNDISRAPTAGDNAIDLERQATALSRIHTARSQHSGTVGATLKSRQSRKPLPEFGGGKPYPPPLPAQEEYVVEFDGADDPLHPFNWPLSRK